MIQRPPSDANTRPPDNQPCRRCGKRHRSWGTVAQCRFPKVYWSSGSGPWASVSFCRGLLTVQLYASRAAAVEAKAGIDAYGCGGGCCKLHSIVDLSVGYARQEVRQ